MRSEPIIWGLRFCCGAIIGDFKHYAYKIFELLRGDSFRLLLILSYFILCLSNYFCTIYIKTVISLL